MPGVKVTQIRFGYKMHLDETRHIWIHDTPWYKVLSWAHNSKKCILLFYFCLSLVNILPMRKTGIYKYAVTCCRLVVLEPRRCSC